jgi:hypothetical protein
MRLERTLAIVVCAVLLWAGVIGSALHALAQDAGEVDPVAGSWSAGGTGSADISADESSPDASETPLDIQDDSPLKSTATPHEEVTFSKKMKVTVSPYSSCGSGEVCLQLQGGSRGVSFSGNFQMTDCGPRGMQTCCNTFGYDEIETAGILGSFLMSYSGLTCSESDSEEMFHGKTTASISSGSGKGTRRLSYDPQTGTGTLSMLAFLHVPTPPPSHRCGTQKCYSKGCCNDGCCFVCEPPFRGCL